MAELAGALYGYLCIVSLSGLLNVLRSDLLLRSRLGLGLRNRLYLLLGSVLGLGDRLCGIFFIESTAGLFNLCGCGKIVDILNVSAVELDKLVSQLGGVRLETEISLLFVYGHTPDLYGGKLAEVLASTAAAKTSLSFSDAFIRGVLCNFLVCIAVWITIGASNGADKVLGLYPPIFVFVLAGYEHCVANMFYIPAGIFASYEYNIAADGLNWLTFFTRNLIPVTLGNIIGGALIVGGGYFFAFLSGSKKAEEKKDGKKK